ncbi:hypothetical protein DV113_003893 [Geotrichum candidum]|uniref:Similar to Saccharomyces cerevisiae YGL056C SDS23 One of two S. cerevisiae homologs (Sds23p and Sds24p) of the S. pombe Sds23 protein, which is implicated in APC/cyclosome regulation n=1 Tax=Geotrichum candidum TaxID=1173061 RepID=A0A0J9X6Q4_GEOCN|nr:hypothetical protein DV452_003446 [Geotrichum candidum]KAF7498063.1 hypothetical protein DV113_003893 [Geotrichum candidum]KAI8132636.1 hypothetical protein DUD61_003716 [Geotrichum candidum]KAI9213893.1 hypothetical protein DS838_001222 [Geotrichum bryndzae]CDO52475.1 similar to Saccharomyces cerevisiae YGL056C SDS23 One of two S. cerevisiae homologs (Sds23p and Sds24p) of the S. pombe Sds23 protein, which is implicated in APC/cyclosome regulation [Geotrichum candidum]
MADNPDCITQSATGKLRANRNSDIAYDNSVPNSPDSKRQLTDVLATPPPISQSQGDHIAQRKVSNSSLGASSEEPSSPVSTSRSVSGSHSRDWQTVPMSELVQRENLVFVESSTSVESAFEILEKNHFTSLPIKNDSKDTFVFDTFDYADLITYLLLVLGRIEPADGSNAEVIENVNKARAGQVVPVKFAAQLSAKNPFLTLKSTDTIPRAVEILGSGVHRVAVLDANNPEIVVGILSQRRLLRFIWEQGRVFTSLQPLFHKSLEELGIGSKGVISIQGDKLVIDALQKMHDEKVSSLAVTDSSNNLLGNISVVDARLLTKSSQKSLLHTTCKSFLGVILSKRGLEDGKDSFPVFHVTTKTSLARTIAKLVATKAHRLWIVQSSSEQLSSALSCRSTSAGQLVGVVSITDILYTLAREAGTNKSDLHPHNARRERRRSSSSSIQSRASLDKFRRSISIERPAR